MSKFDPLEEAKITDDKSEKRLFGKKKKKAEAEAAAEPPLPPEPAAEPAPAPKAPVPAPQTAKAPAPKRATQVVSVDPAKKYRVLEDRMTSVGGRMTKLRAGKVLEARFYGGPLALQRILESGVKVEEC